MALPVGGALGSIALPLLAGAGGLKAAFLATGGLVFTGAVTAAVFMRDAPPAPPGGTWRRRARAPCATRASCAWASRAGCSSARRRPCSASSCSSCTTRRAVGCVRRRDARGAAARSARWGGSSPAAGRTARSAGSADAPPRRSPAPGLLATSAVLTRRADWVVVPLVLVAGVATMMLERARVHRRRGDLRARAGRHGDERAEHDDAVGTVSRRSRSARSWSSRPGGPRSRRWRSARWRHGGCSRRSSARRSGARTRGRRGSRSRAARSAETGYERYGLRRAPRRASGRGRS